MNPKPQTIVRVAKNSNNPFVMLDKRVTEDVGLSWKAKGIMAYLLSRPDDWTVNVADLTQRSADGVAAVRTGLEELERAGYVVRRQRREQGRFMGYELLVYEQPVPVGQRSDPVQRKLHIAPPSTDFPYTENPITENPITGNRDHTNTEITNMDDEADAILAAVSRLYQQEIGGTLSPLLFDELCELTAECRDLARWQFAFKASLGKHSRWAYVKAIIAPKPGAARPTGAAGAAGSSGAPAAKATREAATTARALNIFAELLGQPGPVIDAEVLHGDR